MNVRYLLTGKGVLHSISPEQTLPEAIRLMMHHRIGSLAVRDKDRLVSIVTERDILRALNEHGSDYANLKVKELMAPQLVTCEADDSLDRAMELMFDNVTGQRIRHLPVLDGDSLVGMLSIGDIVHGLLTETRFENKLLRHYIKCWPDEEGEVAP